MVGPGRYNCQDYANGGWPRPRLVPVARDVSGIVRDRKARVTYKERGSGDAQADGKNGHISGLGWFDEGVSLMTRRADEVTGKQ